LRRDVERLQQQVEETIRRQKKEVIKKQESLTGLIEELGEKIELIEELKSNVRML
jgi:hypothetical protein